MKESTSINITKDMNISQKKALADSLTKKLTSTKGLGELNGTAKEVLIMATAVAVQLILSLIPGVDIIFAITMFESMIDPYDYNNTLTRSGIDGIADMIINNISQTLKDQMDKLVPQVFQQLSPTNPDLTIEQVKLMLEKMTNFWVLVDNPQVQPQCYGNYEKDKTLTGAPIDGCNDIYTEYYQEFYSENRDAYINNNYEASARLFKNLITSNINVYRSNILKGFGLISAMSIFFIIIIFILYKIIWRQKKN